MLYEQLFFYEKVNCYTNFFITQMLKIFLILSYYDFEISGDSHSYFHDFQFLKYGFKKNENYRINF